MLTVNKRIKYLQSQSANNPFLVKTAEISAASIESAVKEHIPNFSYGNVIDFIGPTIIGRIVNSVFKTSLLGNLVDFSLRIFDVSLDSIVSEVCSAVKNAFGSDLENVNPEKLQEVVERSVTNTLNKTSDTQAEANYQKIVGATTTTDSLDLGEDEELDVEGLESIGSAYALKRFVEKRRVKMATPAAAKVGNVSAARLSLISIFSKLFVNIFKFIFKSAALFAVTSAIGKAVGIPTTFDRFTTKDPFAWKLQFDVTPSTLKIYPLNPSFSESINTAPWKIFGLNGKDENALKSTFIDWTQDIYQNVTPEEIKASDDFNELVGIIRRYNGNIPYDNLTVFPEKFRTKREVVNYFINDVAEKSPKSTKPSSTAETKQ